MNAPLPRELEQGIAFKLNGADVVAGPDETIIEAAERLGVEIPRLCYKPGMRPDGNCRACMVEIKGERVLAPSCCRRPAPGMEVASDSERAVHSQKMVLELLVVRHARARVQARRRARAVARRPRHRQAALRVARPARAPTCRIRRWR